MLLSKAHTVNFYQRLGNVYIINYKDYVQYTEYVQECVQYNMWNTKEAT